MATVIDAFLVTLGLDPKDFSTAVQQVIKEQEQLRKESEHTAQHMQEQGEKAAEFFTTILEKAGILFGALASFHEMKEFMHEEQEAQITTLRLAQNLKITTEQLGEYQEVAARLGGSAQGVNSSLEAFGEKLEKVGTKLRGAKMMTLAFQQIFGPGFQESAIKGKPAIEVLDMLHEKLKGMSYFKAKAMTQMMGLHDPGLIRSLIAEGEEIDELKERVNELGFASEEQGKASIEWEHAQKDVAQANRSMGRVIMDMLVPAMKAWAKIQTEISQWATKHPQEIRLAFLTLTSAVTAFGVAAVFASISLSPLIVGALGIAAAVGAIAAAVAYVYLEWEKWTKGGESSLGKLFTAVKQFWDAIGTQIIDHFYQIWYNLKDGLDAVIETIKLVWALLMGDGDAAADAWEKLSERLLTIVKRLANTILYEFSFMMFRLIESWEAQWEKMKKAPLDTLKELANNPIARFIMAGGNPIQMAAMKGMDMGREKIENRIHSSMGLPPGQGMLSAAASHISRALHIGEVYINAPNATDAAGVANGLHDGLIQQFDTGMPL